MDKSCYGLYTLYDKVAEECSNIYYARNDAHIIRMMRDSKQNPLEKDDLELYCLGSIDVTTMDINRLDRPRLVQYDSIKE